MAAVALALDEDRPDLPTTPSRTRPRRRRQKTRVRHHCGMWHGPEGRAFFPTSITRCTIHDTVMLELGDYGRPYPEPVCYRCLPPHERYCPMGDASVLRSWLLGITCLCESRLRLLGLKVQAMPGAKGRPKVWGIGPG